MTILLLLAFLLLFFIWSRIDSGDLRVVWVRTTISFSTILLFITLWLSLFDGFTRNSVAISWLIIVVGLLVMLRGVEHSGSLRKRFLPWGSMTGNERGMLFILLMICLLTLVTASVKPPNTWDSMTYHMARVSAWIQHGNVSFFNTPIGRQNYSMPLAEYAIAHLQLLSASDHFANLVQWFSFLSSVMLVSLIAREFGLDRQFQLFAAVLASTIPMGVLQSSSTQNDLVATMFCLAFAWGLLRLHGKSSYLSVLFCGLSLGLALLTKGTSYIFCAAMGTALGLRGLYLARIGSMGLGILRSFTAIVLIALLLNSSHFVRNTQAYGHPLSSDVTEKQIAYHLRPALLAGNLMKNTALHLVMKAFQATLCICCC
jgi:hypothetical protein